MRVTGGELRSRRLRGPSRSMPLRPTPDAVRERLFAILGDPVAGCRMLDLYAGTGAVGIEALSRGAASVAFVEAHRAAARLVVANLVELGIGRDRTRILTEPARRAVARLARRGDTFDLAWADPPFEIWTDGAAVLAEGFEAGVLTATAVACLECPAEADAGRLPSPLEVVRDLGGGASRVIIVRRG